MYAKICNEYLTLFTTHRWEVLRGPEQIFSRHNIIVIRLKLVFTLCNTFLKIFIGIDVRIYFYSHSFIITLCSDYQLIIFVDHYRTFFGTYLSVKGCSRYLKSNSIHDDDARHYYATYRSTPNRKRTAHAWANYKIKNDINNIKVSLIYTDVGHVCDVDKNPFYYTNNRFRLHICDTYCECIQIKNVDRQLVYVSGLTKVALGRSGENKHLYEFARKDYVEPSEKDVLARDR